MNILKQDLSQSLERFIDHIEPYRLRWIQERIQMVPWPRESFRMPRWQSHRGYWLEGAPQNTLASLIEAKKKGASMVEFDVRLTKDRIPVLFHDPDLKAEGKPELKVHQMSFEELKNELKSRYPVASLKEVLLSKDVPDYLNVELKSEQIWDDPLERRVADVVKETGAQGRILFSSFNPFSIWKITSLLPQVPRALLVTRDIDRRSLREMWLAPFLKIHLLHLDKEMVTESSMRQWKRMNVPIGVWTAKDAAEIEHFLDLGVATVISDALPSSKTQPGSAPELQ